MPTLFWHGWPSRRPAGASTFIISPYQYTIYFFTPAEDHPCQPAPMPTGKRRDRRRRCGGLSLPALDAHVPRHLVDRRHQLLQHLHERGGVDGLPRVVGDAHHLALGHPRRAEVPLVGLAGQRAVVALLVPDGDAVHL